MKVLVQRVKRASVEAEQKIAGVNAQKEPLKLKVKLPMIEAGKEVKVYSDNKDLEGDLQTVKLNKRQEVQITIPCNGGMVIIG